VKAELVRRLQEEEIAINRDAIGPNAFQNSRFREACNILEKVVLGTEFVVFLTIFAYEYID